MVERQLRARGVTDAQVLEVMLDLPRESFVPEEHLSAAYSDRAVPLRAGATISQPFVVGAMTQALDVGPRDRVLEVGTGSGYQTAILARIADQVFTLERIPELMEEARRRLDLLGLRNIQYRTGDGSVGWPEEAPFDRILVTAAVPRIPESLMGQLNPNGGRIVAPVGPRTLQRLVRVTRDGDEFEETRLMDVRFVPLVGSEGF
jgi:protein-L-isoaspartate(D-aspartate) O-methyltransferase